jgi:hypothetical protein
MKYLILILGLLSGAVAGVLTTNAVSKRSTSDALGHSLSSTACEFINGFEFSKGSCYSACESIATRAEFKHLPGCEIPLSVDPNEGYSEDIVNACAVILHGVEI